MLFQAMRHDKSYGKVAFWLVKVKHLGMIDLNQYNGEMINADRLQ